MCKEPYERYKWMERQLETDAEYLHLMARLHENMPDFQAALNALTEEQKMAIIEHLGICAELADRSAEIACCAP